MNRKEQTQATRKAILDSAMELFGEKDFASTSINDISKNASISKGIVYHYFQNKDDLYLECVKISFDSLIAHLSTFPNTTGSIEHIVGNFLQFRHDFFIKNPNIKNVFFGFKQGKFQISSQEIMAKQTLLNEVNQSFFKKALGNIQLKKGITTQDVLQTLMMLQSSNLPQVNPEPISPDTFMLEQEKFTRTFLKIIFHGIIGEENNDTNH